MAKLIYSFWWFLCRFHSFSRWMIMSSANKGILLFQLQYQCLLLLILPIKVVRTSSTIFNKTGERTHFCLVLNLMRKLFSLWSPSVVLDMNFLLMCLFLFCFCYCDWSGWGSFPPSLLCCDSKIRSIWWILSHCEMVFFISSNILCSEI